MTDKEAHMHVYNIEMPLANIRNLLNALALISENLDEPQAGAVNVIVHAALEQVREADGAHRACLGHPSRSRALRTRRLAGGCRAMQLIAIYVAIWRLRLAPLLPGGTVLRRPRSAAARPLKNHPLVFTSRRVFVRSRPAKMLQHGYKKSERAPYLYEASAISTTIALQCEVTRVSNQCM